jgi:hypothetical protein
MDGSAGWFEDPDRAHELRFHDGTHWTAHVWNRGVRAICPMEERPPPAYAVRCEAALQSLLAAQQDLAAATSGDRVAADALHEALADATLHLRRLTDRLPPRRRGF